MSWVKLICILIASIFSQLTNGVIPRDSACGGSKTCWPAECPVDGCVDFLVTMQNATEQQYVRFEMKMEFVPTGEHYIALGVSADNQMASSSIVMCRSDANVELGYTQGRTYVPSTSNVGIRDTSFSVANNITTCSFERIRVPSGNEPQLRTLTEAFFLIRAWGSVTGGVPRQHSSANRGVSPIQYTFPAGNSSGHTLQPTSVSLCACLIGALLFLVLR